MFNAEKSNDSDLVQPDVWLRKFRKAESLDTLDIMHNGAERHHINQIAILVAINLAAAHREKEIKLGRFLNLK